MPPFHLPVSRSLSERCSSLVHAFYCILITGNVETLFDRPARMPPASSSPINITISYWSLLMRQPPQNHISNPYLEKILDCELILYRKLQLIPSDIFGTGAVQHPGDKKKLGLVNVSLQCCALTCSGRLSDLLSDPWACPAREGEQETNFNSRQLKFKLNSKSTLLIGL